MSIGLSTLIEYSVAFVVLIIIVNRSVDEYFARYTKKEGALEQSEEIQKIEVAPIIPPAPPLYDIYPPTIFSKQRTRQFYWNITFKKEYFLDEPWLSTLVEILSLLELATDESVIKNDGRTIKMVIGTLGTPGVKTGEIFEAYNLYELTLAIAEDFVRYEEDKANFREMVLAILLLYIDHIPQIHHWIPLEEQESLLGLLAEYMTRNMPFENQEIVLHLINEIHNSLGDMGIIEELQSRISMIQNDMELVTKLIDENQKNYSWPKTWLTHKMQKQSLTMIEIRRF
ncbi:MAG: hypothetical protein Q8M39_05565 [Sulfuricurvum sp.]|nr:hypothetical protein [Sulfuricurvum sp.]